MHHAASLLTGVLATGQRTKAGRCPWNHLTSKALLSARLHFPLFEWEVEPNMTAEDQQCHTQQYATCWYTGGRPSASRRSSVVKHLPVTKCWQQQRQNRAGISYQVSDHHYEYEYHQCLASLRLILWFSAAEELSGTLGFLTHQLVCTRRVWFSPVRRCLIFDPEQKGFTAG